MNSAMLREYCRLDAASAALLERAMERVVALGAGLRPYPEGGRTIADLAGRADIVQADIAGRRSTTGRWTGNWGR